MPRAGLLFFLFLVAGTSAVARTTRPSRGDSKARQLASVDRFHVKGAANRTRLGRTKGSTANVSNRFRFRSRISPSTLTLCLGTAFAAVISTSALALPPATWTVDTCNDDNSGDLNSRTGSLRFAVTNAAGGSKIDLSQLPAKYGCSVITLKTGSIKSGLAIGQNDLTLEGPHGSRVTIAGERSGSSDSLNLSARIIDHQGVGTLSLNNLAVESGPGPDIDGPLRGGSIYSRGRVSLSHSSVYGATIISSAVAASAAPDADAIATPERPYLPSPPVYGD